MRTEGRPVERTLKTTLLLTDAACIAAVWFTIACTDFAFDRLLVASVATVVALTWLGAHAMYYGTGKEGTRQTARLYEAALLAAGAANVADAHLDVPLGAGVLVVGVVVGALALHAGRLAYRTRIEHAHRCGRHLRRAVVVGAPADVVSLADRLRRTPELGYSVVATVGGDCPADVTPLARASGGDTVIVVPGTMAAPALATIVREATNAGLHVQLVGVTTGIDPRRVQPRPFGREASLHVLPVSLDGWQSAVKRAFDLVVAGCALVVLSPVLAVCALAVKLGGGGPVLFRQERVGRAGQPFVMFKFRSMVVDAELRLAELAEHNERTGPLFKLSCDPRVTRVGRFLRATSLDELPQLFNVLLGDMSLVGPRPALAAEVESFGPNLRRRETVLPGITGLWQIEGRDDPDFAVYEETDLYYVENWSVGLDLVILSRTAAAVVRRVARKLRRGPDVRPVVLD